MKTITISNFLPDTVNNPDRPQAAEFKAILSEIAAESNAEIKLFEVEEGKVTVAVSSEEALGKIKEELKRLESEGVKVEEMSQLRALFSKNKQAQLTINQRRETKNKNKQQKMTKQ
jgi:hypothetical protein